MACRCGVAQGARAQQTLPARKRRPLGQHAVAAGRGPGAGGGQRLERRRLMDYLDGRLEIAGWKSWRDRLQAAARLASVLEGNSTLRCLHLRRAAIDPLDAARLAVALEANHTLTSLNGQERYYFKRVGCDVDMSAPAEVAPPIYKILVELLLFSKPAGVNCLCHPLMSGFTLKLLYNVLLSPRGSF